MALCYAALRERNMAHEAALLAPHGYKMSSVVAKQVNAGVVGGTTAIAAASNNQMNRAVCEEWPGIIGHIITV